MSMKETKKMVVGHTVRTELYKLHHKLVQEYFNSAKRWIDTDYYFLNELGTNNSTFQFCI